MISRVGKIRWILYFQWFWILWMAENVEGKNFFPAENFYLVIKTTHCYEWCWFCDRCCSSWITIKIWSFWKHASMRYFVFFVAFSSIKIKPPWSCELKKKMSMEKTLEFFPRSKIWKYSTITSPTKLMQRSKCGKLQRHSNIRMEKLFVWLTLNMAYIWLEQNCFTSSLLLSRWKFVAKTRCRLEYEMFFRGRTVNFR